METVSGVFLGIGQFKVSDDQLGYLAHYVEPMGCLVQWPYGTRVRTVGGLCARAVSSRISSASLSNAGSIEKDLGTLVLVLGIVTQMQSLLDDVDRDVGQPVSPAGAAV